MHSLIKAKLFRIRENQNKINFIVANSGITENTLIKAAILAKKNPYHNFGHALGATEYAIKIAMAEKRKSDEINLITLAMLFHDARHRGFVQLYDEARAIEGADEVLDESDTEVTLLGRNTAVQKIRNLVLATIFPDARGIQNDPLARIVQDADLAHLGQGPIYWLWSSMGLIEEFNLNRQTPLTADAFIYLEQEKFVSFLSTLSGTGKVYLSEGALATFGDPLIDVQNVKKFNSKVVEYAYDVRYKDVTIEEFTAHVESLK